MAGKLVYVWVVQQVVLRAFLVAENLAVYLEIDQENNWVAYLEQKWVRNKVGQWDNKMVEKKEIWMAFSLDAIVVGLKVAKLVAYLVEKMAF